MDLGVKGKVAFITGGGEGIGQEVACMLAADGADISVADMDVAGVKNTAEKIKKTGARCLHFELDVTNQEQVNQAVQNTIETFKRVDMLVHIPGQGEKKPFTSSSKNDWDFSVNLNLYGPLYSAKAVIEQMIKQESGSLVFVVSDAGRIGQNNNSIYSAAKGGVIAFTKALAREVGRYNVRANCVALSAMNTPGGVRFINTMAERLGKDPEEIKKKVLSGFILRRFGEPEDAASAIAFLSSARASWITGQTLSVNGGYTMV